MGMTETRAPDQRKGLRSVRRRMPGETLHICNLHIFQNKFMKEGIGV